jgi:hypothetical protein
MVDVNCVVELSIEFFVTTKEQEWV